MILVSKYKKLVAKLSETVTIKFNQGFFYVDEADKTLVDLVMKRFPVDKSGKTTGLNRTFGLESHVPEDWRGLYKGSDNAILNQKAEKLGLDTSQYDRTQLKQRVANLEVFLKDSGVKLSYLTETDQTAAEYYKEVMSEVRHGSKSGESIEELKEEAKDLGLTFRPNIGYNKLKQRVEAKKDELENAS